MWNALVKCKVNIGLSLYPDNISPCQGEWKCFKNSGVESASAVLLGVTRRQELWILNRRLSQDLGVKVKIWSEMWGKLSRQKTQNRNNNEMSFHHKMLARHLYFLAFCLQVKLRITFKVKTKLILELKLSLIPVVISHLGHNLLLMPEMIINHTLI